MSSLEVLFAKPAVLPVVPKVVQQLIESFRRDDVSIAEIAAHLAADPVLSAKTLRLANSAYFHVSRRIATVDEALQMLGFVMVRNLVLGLGIAGSFKHVPGIDLPQFWRYSLHTACAARWLAQAAGRNADLAFTIGLVHALGQLVLHTVLPDDAQAIDRECHPLSIERAHIERRQLGYHHGEATAELALGWNFPAEVSHPLRLVPDPLACDPPMAMAALVHVAAWRARIDALDIDAETAQASCPREVGLALGLDLAWMVEPSTLDAGAAGAMPALSELTRGLEAMLD